LGEGDNGIAYKYEDKTIKITKDAGEAVFAGKIKGHKLKYVSNVYEVYEYDRGEGIDNKESDVVVNGRYYWIIVKEYIPHRFSDGEYYNILVYFDNYQEKNKNFDYSEKAFNNMIREYRNEHIEYMKDEDGYDPEEDYELESSLDYLEMFKELHLELHPMGIKSVMDMKISNMGSRDNGDIVYLELHIFKYFDDFKDPEYTILK
jgi:hypothetical protein